MENLIPFLEHYKYAILFPLAMTGGPLVTVIGASLASSGILDVRVVYTIAVLANVTGDTMYYWIGRSGRHTLIPKYGHYIGITEKRITHAEEHYQKHLGKTLLFGKITEAAIIPILIAAGATKVSFGRFLGMVIPIEIPKMLAFTFIGYYFGKYYVLIKQYSDTSVAIGFAIVIMTALVYWFLIRKK